MTALAKKNPADSYSRNYILKKKINDKGKMLINFFYGLLSMTNKASFNVDITLCFCIINI